MTVLDDGVRQAGEMNKGQLPSNAAMLAARLRALAADFYAERAGVQGMSARTILLHAAELLSSGLEDSADAVPLPSNAADAALRESRVTRNDSTPDRAAQWATIDAAAARAPMTLEETKLKGQADAWLAVWAALRRGNPRFPEAGSGIDSALAEIARLQSATSATDPLPADAALHCCGAHGFALGSEDSCPACEADRERQGNGALTPQSEHTASGSSSTAQAGEERADAPSPALAAIFSAFDSNNNTLRHAVYREIASLLAALQARLAATGKAETDLTPPPISSTRLREIARGENVRSRGAAMESALHTMADWLQHQEGTGR